ncbi:hypothetical protein QF042_001735 [Pedobacter sp. W3I1]|uniref:hypothetical protein n=1 Tax=Pedobacter sp. W3I1 TaxID=3042291 RepID=UPI00277F4944|nr:hypothetical protein [Pedobacter sp. W3I1]MDQ0638170.1 hypothetical protein [Pedobacter sp. W3I1]
MENVEFLLAWTEDLKKEIETLNFDADDIRKDFFKLFYDSTYSYYLGYVSYALSSSIIKGDVVFKENLSPFKVHLDRLIEISQLPILTKSYKNALNRNLNIETWSIFELCVTTFCNALSNEEELNKLLRYNFNDILKILNKSTIDDNNLEKLKQKLIVEHLSHVPIQRKVDFLFKKGKHYYRDSKKDREFLVFYGKLRNTLHSNYIYHGNEYEYKFGEAHFLFNKGKLVKWTDPFAPSPKLYIYLSAQLKEIWKTLVLSIKHGKKIEYPDLDQN